MPKPRGLSEQLRIAEVQVPVFDLGLLPSLDPMRFNAALDDVLSEDALLKNVNPLQA